MGLHSENEYYLWTIRNRLGNNRQKYIHLFSLYDCNHSTNVMRDSKRYNKRYNKNLSPLEYVVNVLNDGQWLMEVSANSFYW